MQLILFSDESVNKNFKLHFPLLIKNYSTILFVNSLLFVHFTAFITNSFQ